MGRKAAAEPRPKAQRNVVGIEESDDLSSEQGGDHAHARKRQRAEDAAASQLGSKRAHQTQLAPDASAAAAAGTDAGGHADEPMEQQQQQQVPPQDSPQQDQPEQQLQRRRSTSAGRAAASAAAAARPSDGGTPFAAQAAFATATPFPEQQPDDTPPGGAAAAPSGGTGEGGSGGRQRPKRQPKPRKVPGLTSQPSGFSGPQLGTRFTSKAVEQANAAATELFPGPQDDWGSGSNERPEVAAPDPLPVGEAALGWGVWVCYNDMNARPWWRGVITCYAPEGFQKKQAKPHYQVVMEDGEIVENTLKYFADEAANGDFVFAYPPKAGGVPAPLSQQLSLPAAGEEAAPDDAAAAAAEQDAPPAAPASAQVKTKARNRGSQQPPKGAPAAGGDAAAEAAAGEPDAEQQPGGSGAHAKKQQPKQQQQQQQQRGKRPVQQKPAPLRAGTPTSPGPPSARPTAPPPLDLSRLNLSDRAGKLARCLQQLQAADQQVAQGLQKQAAALTEMLALNPDFATGKEVKDAGGSELLQTLARCKARADRAALQLGELAGMAEKARCCMHPAGQQRGAMPGGNTPAAAGRPGDAAALAAAKQQLARAQSERAAAEKAAAEARAAAAAEAASAKAARVAEAAAEERLSELESFASRLKLLVPLEALEDGSPVRAKAVALLASVLLPPVAVSPFQAASELEGMLFRGYGLVGAGKDMYLKHLYMIWCVLGGRELAAAAEASSEAARAAEEAAAAAAASTQSVQPGEPDAAVDMDVDVQVKQQAAAAALAKAQEVLAGAPGVADAATVRNALLDGSATVSEVFQLTCSKLGFDKQRDK